MKICVVSPTCTSLSAKKLAKKLNCDYHNPYKTDTMLYPEHDKVINFGVTRLYNTPNLINKASAIRISINKLTTFKHLKKTKYLPKYTTKRDLALTWLKNKELVVVRNILVGAKSEGTKITDKETDLEFGLLFTKYIEHKKELRVNVYKNKIISVLQKTPDKENNFTFKLLKGFYNRQVEEIIKDISKNISLDLYGMDILQTENGNIYFLELNSGPILFGETLNRMANAIKKDINND